jgi:hypothetical protein
MPPSIFGELPETGKLDASIYIEFQLAQIIAGGLLA